MHVRSSKLIETFKVHAFYSCKSASKHTFENFLYFGERATIVHKNVFAQLEKHTSKRTLLSSFYFATLRRGAGELGDGTSILLQLLQDYRGGKVRYLYRAGERKSPISEFLSP